MRTYSLPRPSGIPFAEMLKASKSQESSRLHDTLHNPNTALDDYSFPDILLCREQVDKIVYRSATLRLSVCWTLGPRCRAILPLLDPPLPQRSVRLSHPELKDSLCMLRQPEDTAITGMMDVMCRGCPDGPRNTDGGRTERSHQRDTSVSLDRNSPSYGTARPSHSFG